MNQKINNDNHTHNTSQVKNSESHTMMNNKQSKSIQRLREQLEKSRENVMSRQKGMNQQANTQQQPNTNTSLYGTLGGNQCSHSDCPRPIYKQKTCKQHFCLQVKTVLKKELRNIFRGPEKAYASMDFYGKGYITEEDFLNSIVITRIPYSKDDVQEFFRQFNIFSSKAARGATPLSDMNYRSVDRNSNKNHNNNMGNYIQDGGMNFDQFKKMFFPQLFLINEEHDSDEDRKLKQKQLDLSGKKNNKDDKNSQQQPENVITDRLKKLEKILKDKFQNQWESVRKAFLALDSDYDGYITVEDILRYFGQEKDLDYNDLKKLIKDKDSKKIGKIGYTDFSKWVGNSIHQSEGFYFRHDSVKNPQFEMNNERNELNLNNKSKIKAQESLINQNLEKTVLDKIQFQWKTLRKAFMDLNMEKSGSIMPEELRFYFKHWGLTLTDEQFKYLFEKFDLDGDGKISYKDFQLTVGSEIHPAEGLYFRQDKPMQIKINSCKHEKCWQPTQGIQNYCGLHLKLHQDECSIVFAKIFSQIKTKWPQFIEDIKKSADQDDRNQIFIDQLLQVLKRYNTNLSQHDINMLQDSFPGRDEGQRVRVNIARIYDHKFNMMLDKIYKKVDVHENDGDDDPVDQSGYTGQFYRQKKHLIPISEFELVQIIARNNKLVEIIRTIKEIDKQHNGFVTTTELDDILKIQYKDELGNKDLKQILKKYSSIQNRVLVDYKKFRDSMVSQIKLVNSSFTYNASLTTDLSVNGVTPIKKQSDKQQQKSSDKINAQRFEGQRNENSNNQSKNDVQNKQVVTLDNNSIIQIQDLLRPQTRQYTRHQDLLDTKSHTISNLKKKNFLKNDILNQTSIYNSTLQTKSKDLNQSLLTSNGDIKLDEINSNSKSFQNLSKTPNQTQQKLRLRERQSVDNQHTLESNHTKTFDNIREINDYSDMQIVNKNNNGGLNDSLDIQDNIKRAQSSHGVFGRNNNKMNLQRLKTMNAANEANKYPGINNLLQNLREQRRNIQTAIGKGQNQNSNNYDFMNESLAYQQKATLNKTIITKSSQAQIDFIDESFNRNYDSSHTIGVEINRNPQYQSFINRKKSEGLNNTTNIHLNSTNLYQTLNNSSFSTAKSSNKHKNILKSKLSYEWKNIYRQLSMNDKQSNGTVSVQDFENALDQFNVYMSKEEFRKVQNLYGSVQQNHINYLQLSMDLGLHNNHLTFLKNSSVRMQNIQKLRNIYSSSNDKKSRINSLMERASTAQIGGLTINRPLNTASSTSNNNLNANVNVDQASVAKEMSKAEIQQVLLSKIKEFRDIISNYQRQNNTSIPIIPANEFKKQLLELGINISKESLRKFIVHNAQNEEMKLGDRSKSVGSTRNIMSNGVDAREFMKYYI